MKTELKKSTSFRSLTALAVCALALAAIGSVKNPVSRPLRVQGNVTVAVNLSEGTWVSHDVGVGTHTGRYDNHGAGHLDAQGNIVGGGIGTAANGDQVCWVAPGSSWEIQLTGGTGRFENLSGGFNTVFQTKPVIAFPDPNTMVQTYSYIGVGTAKY